MVLGIRILRGTLVAATAAAVVGCATTGSSGSSAGGPTAADRPTSCNKVAMAFTAAAVCGIATKKAGWAAACAAMAVAGCALYDNYQAKQAKTAAQVEEEYRAAQGDLPDVPTLAGYQTNFTPSEVVEKGGTVKADVEILVVPGKEGGPILIEEEWAMYDAKGEKWLGPVRKAVNASNREAGLYVGGFSLNLPKEMPQGKYEFRSQVYLNGSAVTGVTQGIQIAHHQADPNRVVLAQR